MLDPKFIYAHNADFFRKDRSQVPFEMAYVIFSEIELSEEEQREIVERCMGYGNAILLNANMHKTRLMIVDSEKKVTIQPLYTLEEALEFASMFGYELTAKEREPVLSEITSLPKIKDIQIPDIFSLE